MKRLNAKFSIQPSLRLEFVDREVSFNTNFNGQNIENSILIIYLMKQIIKDMI